MRPEGASSPGRKERDTRIAAGLILSAWIIGFVPADSQPAPAGRVPVLCTARAHPMRYYLALPAAGAPEASRPILVACSPRGQAEATAEAYAAADPENRFLVVAPVIVSNSGKRDPSDLGYGPEVVARVAREAVGQFDEEGILAVVAELQADHGAPSRFFITGFSAGGHATWLTVFLHPDLLAGAALSAGNFIGRGLDGRSISAAPGRARLPVREIIGSEDGYYQALWAQWQKAQSLARANGYGNLSEQIVPARPHEPLVAEVMAFFVALLPHQTERQGRTRPAQDVSS